MTFVLGIIMQANEKFITRVQGMFIVKKKFTTCYQYTKSALFTNSFPSYLNFLSYLGSPIGKKGSREIFRHAIGLVVKVNGLD